MDNDNLENGEPSQIYRTNQLSNKWCWLAHNQLSRYLYYTTKRVDAENTWISILH